MKNIKCDNCGADMELVDGQYKCPYCGGIKPELNGKNDIPPAAETPAARPLEVVREDYKKRFGIFRKLSMIMFVSSLFSIAGAVLTYFTFFNDDIGSILPIAGIFIFAAFYSLDLIICVYSLKINYVGFVAVSDELSEAEGGKNEVLSKDAHNVCAMFKLRALFAILPLVVVAALVFAIVAEGL